MHTPDDLRKRAARARSLANVKNHSRRPRSGLVYLLELAAEFERQAEVLERAGQKPKLPTTS